MYENILICRDLSYTGDVEWRNTNLSMIIVACKSDLLKVDDAISLKIARTAQGQLRAIGLAIGAAVIYTSSKSDINTARLRRHVIGKLYPEASCIDESIEVNKSLFRKIYWSYNPSVTLSLYFSFTSPAFFQSNYYLPFYVCLTLRLFICLVHFLHTKTKGWHYSGLHSFRDGQS